MLRERLSAVWSACTSKRSPSRTLDGSTEMGFGEFNVDELVFVFTDSKKAHICSKSYKIATLGVA